jgi:hypothetical protein
MQIFSWYHAFSSVDSRLKNEARRLMPPGDGKAAGTGGPAPAAILSSGSPLHSRGFSERQIFNC